MYGGLTNSNISLAYTEMRLILALIIYNFDMKLDPSSCDWIRQRNFTLWQKPPLKVYLEPVAGESQTLRSNQPVCIE